MPLTVQQIKGRLKSVAQKNHADARQKKFTYAAEISYNDVIDSIKELFELITM